MAVLDPATQAPAVGDTGVYNGVNLIGVATGLVAYPATWKPVVSANDASHEVVNGTATQLLALNAAYTETSTPTEAQLIELATANGAKAGNGFTYDTEDGATIYREVKTLGAGITLAAPISEYWDYPLEDLSTLDLTNFTSGAKVRLFRDNGVVWIFEVDDATNGGKSWLVLDDGSGGSGGADNVTPFDAGGIAKSAVPAALEAAHPAATEGAQAKRYVYNIDPTSVPNLGLVSNIYQVLERSDGATASLQWIESI